MTVRSTLGRRLLVLCFLGLLAGCTSGPTGQRSSDPVTEPTSALVQPTAGTGMSSAPSTTGAEQSVDPAQAAAIRSILAESMQTYGLKAAIVKVTVDGRDLITAAMGESMPGVPATADMHFRNGAVAISYVATLLLELVDEGTVRLDDKVSTWLPDVPYADQVTLGQLASMTSGYADYVPNEQFLAANSKDPFRKWQPEELIAYGAAQPLLYEPGTNWSYSHTGYVILGLALEKATGTPMKTLMQEKVLGPLGLTNTTDPESAAITGPVLHAYSSERREFLGVPADRPFYEESTFWDPSWTISRGAIQTTDIDDLNASAIGIGTGKLLSPESYQAMVSTKQRDFGGPDDRCMQCHRGDDIYTYGIGIVIKKEWLVQNPAFGGYSAVMAYLPSKKIAISIAVTYAENGFDEQGLIPRQAGDPIFVAIATQLAPDDAPSR